MKTISSGLATLFAGGNAFLMADCYTFTLTNGTILKYAAYDADVTYSSNTWLANAPVLTRNSVRTVIGLEVGTLQITISPSDTDVIGSQTWLQAVCSGVLDGALVSLDRAFMDLTGAVAGTVNQFTGYVAQISVDRMNIDMTVNSPLDALSIQMPRNLYQASCQHALFDAGCGANKVTFTSSGTVTGTPSILSFSSGISGATGRYNLGVLQFTSGALTGTKRTVKSWAGGVFTLLNPLPLAPSAGDAFTVSAGCDHTVTTCTNVFSNLANFKGFPFIPVPETAS